MKTSNVTVRCLLATLQCLLVRTISGCRRIIYKESCAIARQQVQVTVRSPTFTILINLRYYTVSYVFLRPKADG